MFKQPSDSQVMQSLVDSFKSNLKSVNGEVIENLSDFFDSIILSKQSNEKVVVIDSKESLSNKTARFKPDKVLAELKNKGFTVLFADELFKSGNYRETMFEKCVLSITFPMLGIADTGTIIENNPIRSISLLPPVHLAILKPENIVSDMKSALAKLSEIYTDKTGRIVLPSAITFITGPSRTADIEQTLTVGVHGPIRQAVLIECV